jgi:hypothetical protein
MIKGYVVGSAEIYHAQRDTYNVATKIFWQSIRRVLCSCLNKTYDLKLCKSTTYEGDQLKCNQIKTQSEIIELQKAKERSAEETFTTEMNS